MSNRFDHTTVFSDPTVPEGEVQIFDVPDTEIKPRRIQRLKMVPLGEYTLELSAMIMDEVHKLAPGEHFAVINPKTLEKYRNVKT